MQKTTVQHYVKDGIKYTVAGAQPAPRGVNYTTKHLGKSDSAAARYTGRYNHS